MQNHKSKKQKKIAIRNNEDAQVMAASVESYSSGPIPSPEEFIGYREVMPDLPERIITQFELDSDHIREMQKKAQDADIRYDLICLSIAAFVITLGLVSTVLLAYFEKDYAAITTGVSTAILVFKGLFHKKQ